MSSFSLFKRQTSHRSLEKLHENLCTFTEVNKCNNIALVLSVSMQKGSDLMLCAAENRWNFQSSQHPGPLFHRTAQPLYSAFWASLFLAFLASQFKLCHHTHIQDCIHMCSFWTVWGKWKGNASIFAMLKGEWICLEGNKVWHLLSSSPKGCQCCYVGQAPA